MGFTTSQQTFQLLFFCHILYYMIQYYYYFCFICVISFSNKIYILLLFYFSPLPNIYTQKPARFFKIHELTIKMIENVCLVIIILSLFSPRETSHPVVPSSSSSHHH